MYGMLLESVQHFIQLEHGEAGWLALAHEVSGVPTAFNTHSVYPDSLMFQLASACSSVFLDRTTDEYLTHFGRCFVKFFSNFGYEKIVRSTGRYFAEFLQNVDNIHLQMRFSYPKMKSPSMFLTEMNSDGVTLVYRSSKNGFKHYLYGQLMEIANSFYGIGLEIELVTEKYDPREGVELVFLLKFDNGDLMKSGRRPSTIPPLPHITSDLLLKLFPFALLFGRMMRVVAAGEKVVEFLGKPVVGQQVDKLLSIRRPQGLKFTWNNVLHLHSVSFELELTLEEEMKKTIKRSVLLQGQMRYLEKLAAVIFLCSPVINNLNELQESSLYINDLSLHGLSRELVFSGWTHCSSLELSYEKAEEKCIDLEKNYSLLESWKKKGDDLLYSMIPKSIADRLRRGESPLNTCQSFDEVTVLFAELEGLLSASTVSEVMTAVNHVNEIFSDFDKLVDKYDVYKVETVGQVYMAVSGAPEICDDHTERIARLSMAFRNCADSFQYDFKLKIGFHTGPVVGGIVGVKVPRYCLFGDTVNTAARLQTSSMPSKIQTSIKTVKLLPEGFLTERRGVVQVKGKGDMETYWLCDVL